MSAELDGAYAHCEAVTRREAANFYYGIRLLSRERRRAMCAVYAFARRIDDIGDGALAPGEKLARLDAEQAALAALGTASEDLVGIALADAAGRFPLPLDALGELIEGVRMDLTGVRYETFEELVVYCRRVAGTIGRLCLAIFGPRRGARLEPSWALADDLGVALQLTNILRDVREDALEGRLYLPAQDLRRFGIAGGGDPDVAALLAELECSDRPALTELVHFEAARAREWFDRGMQLTRQLDRRSAACLLAMAGIYRRLLERIDAEPSAALRERASLPPGEKAWVAARGLLGAGI